MHNKLILLPIILLTGCASTEYQTLKTAQVKHQLAAYLQNDMPFAMAKRPASIAPIQPSQNRRTQSLEQAVHQNQLLPIDAAQWLVYQDLSAIAQADYLKQHTDLDTVLSFVLLRNPSIQTAQHAVKAGLQQYSQVQQVDDLLNQYQSWIGKGAAPAFPLPNASALKGNIVDKSVQQARLALEKTIQSVLTQSRVAYFEGLYFQQAASIIAEKVALLERLNAVSEQVYNTTKGSLNTVLSLNDKLATARERLRSIREQAENRWLSLSQLLNISAAGFKPQGKFVMPQKIKTNKTVLINIGLQHAIEIRLLNNQIEKIALLIQLAETRIYPDLAVGNASPVQVKKHRLFLGNAAYLAEMKQQYLALKSQLSSLKNTTTDAINMAYFKIVDSRRQLDLYQNILIPNAQSRFEIDQSLYETGQRDYSKMIAAYEHYLESRLQRAGIQRDQKIAVSRLERLIGQPIIHWTTG